MSDDTVTITISRKDAKTLQLFDWELHYEIVDRLAKVCRAALEETE